MSTKIENVVYRASWRGEISADFSRVSFSTATLNYAQNPLNERNGLVSSLSPAKTGFGLSHGHSETH